MQKASLQKGFTLIEIVVSLGIFTIVALVAVGALLRIMDANKKALSLKTTINNVNFALESMSREMRVGSNYSCTGCGTTGNWTITFDSSKTSGSCNLKYGYMYVASEQTLKKAQEEVCGDTEFNYEEILSPDIKITDTYTKLSNTSPDQPRFFFWLKGHTGDREREKTEFSIQTTVSQRIKD